MQDKFPAHVAFIMDGNGRWAKAHKKAHIFGHRAGYKALNKIIEYAFNRGASVLSFYAFSTENWKRPKDEVSKLLALMRRALKEAAPKLRENKIRLIISGDYSMLKDSVKREIDALIAETSAFTEHTVNVCFNYGSRAEIVRAVNEIIRDGLTEVDEKAVSERLYTHLLPDPDLIVRTSGEQRLSNFLLWQSAYSELYFADVLWPDFDEKEFDKAVEWFSGRDRRFGARH